MKQRAALALLISWCFTLVVLRVIWSGTLGYAYLFWNLFLAAIPVVSAFMLTREVAKSRVKVVIWACIWLLFLPNAPYIATDLIHLQRLSLVIPPWYDVALLLSCAVAGILLGFVSVAEVHRVARHRFGESVAWMGIAVVMFLSAFGIYLGRFQRWNSWEILTHPWLLMMDISSHVFNPLAHPRTLAVTGVYGAALLVGYAVFHLLFFTPPVNSEP